eukprot:gb/GFBE01023750.1/.p1 GENE.gb/GFBE01023750.1/~~gb/GFBE01023750.1/.p1  ORF type:complete len:982 (+),score=172.63 gb/GFBE01023750.1/:1-2946(+)
MPLHLASSAPVQPDCSGSHGAHSPPTADAKGSEKATPRMVGAASQNAKLEHLADSSLHMPACRFMGYYFVCLLGCCGCSALSICLWSSMGYGHLTFEFLSRHSDKRMIGIVAGALVLLGLYIFDFASPPHLPGQCFALWDKDTLVGRSLLGLAVVFFYVSCLLMAKDLPCLPVLSTSLLCPVLLGIIRQVLRPLEPTERIPLADTITRKRILRILEAHEQDSVRFFQAAFVACETCSVACLSVWIAQTYVSSGSEWQQGDEEVDLILWVTPLVVAVSNLVFGLFALLRVCVQSSYVSIDAALKLRLTGASEEEPDSEVIRCSKKQFQLLTFWLQTILVIFIVFTCLLSVTVNLFLAESSFAEMIVGLVAMLCFAFIAFTVLCFRRVVMAIHQTLVEHPVMNTARDVAKSAWVQAAVTCVLLPFVPCVLAISVLNQQVRKARGVYEMAQSKAPVSSRWFDITTAKDGKDDNPVASSHDASTASNPGQLIWTPKIHAVIKAVKNWDPVAVMTRSYLLCFAYFCVVVVKILANACLSWASGVLAGYPYEMIMVATFVIGILAFLLPPVPGLTVYLFGGLMLSNPVTCPYGFWGGSMINIGLCYLLKLVVCAIQQKGIGEFLGRSLWLRRQLGVHKVPIRCMEAVMKQPGMTWGKVAILCGGPDWPTSVLAGFLQLSLVECEIGTLPVIMFIAPCGLSGSFYLKIGTSVFWTKAAYFMIALSVMINVALWVIAASALQKQLAAKHDEISRPLEEHVELEWLDHRDEMLQRACDVRWTTIPVFIRMTFALGFVVHILICQVLFFIPKCFFRELEVHDAIEELVWYSQSESGHGLITDLGIIIVASYLVGWFLFFQRLLWWHVRTRSSMKEASASLAQQEQQWKADFRTLARDAAAAAAETEKGDAAVAPHAQTEGDNPEAANGSTGVRHGSNVTEMHSVASSRARSMQASIPMTQSPAEQRQPSAPSSCNPAPSSCIQDSPDFAAG